MAYIDPYQLLTRAEAAEHLRCRPEYITELTQSGRLYSIRIGKRVLVPRAALEAYIRDDDFDGGDGCWPPTMAMFDPPETPDTPSGPHV